MALGLGVQAVPTALIATASINLSLWFIALPFSYYATLQVVREWTERQQTQQQVTAPIVQDVKY